MAESKLKDYQHKRDFSRSPEPEGNPAAPRKAGRRKLKFCVQKHLASHLHYDLRLEHAGVLMSWAVPKGPSLNPADKRLAMKVEDHPIEYGKFEGVIPEGYGAGIVLLWDTGTWQPEGSEDVDQAMERGELKFTLSAKKLSGSWVLVRTGGRNKTDSRQWLLIKHRDEFAEETDVAATLPMSVKSGGDFADILASAKSTIWQTYHPSGGGEAGDMLRKIVADAAAIRARKRLKHREKRTK